jgi:hypothetical protein
VAANFAATCDVRNIFNNSLFTLRLEYVKSDFPSRFRPSASILASFQKQTKSR